LSRRNEFSISRIRGWVLMVPLLGKGRIYYAEGGT